MIGSYVKRLVEAALGIDSALAAGLALCVNKGSGGAYIVLYDAKEYVKHALANAKHIGEMTDPRTAECVYGFIRMHVVDPSNGESYGSYEIANSVARKGYGPFMYDVAMSLGKPVISDRGSVSPDAQKIWKYYKDNRSDVKKLPLDNKSAPRTPETFDDSIVFDAGKESELTNPLNFAYKSGGIDFSKLTQRHEKVLQLLKTKIPELTPDRVESSLNHFAEDYFIKRYHGV